jgi:hypothetical protein
MILLIPRDLIYPFLTFLGEKGHLPISDWTGGASRQAMASNPMEKLERPSLLDSLPADDRKRIKLNAARARKRLEQRRKERSSENSGAVPIF